MKYQEAIDNSERGIAVRGHSVMKDIIWPKGSSCAYAWIGTSYEPQPGKWVDKEDWEPLLKIDGEVNPSGLSATSVLECKF